jgi:TolA-binding protein
MTIGRMAGAKRWGLLVAGALGAVMLPMSAAAQDDARLRRLEDQVRALQRAVFPGGDGRFFTPEVVTQPTQPQSQQQVGNPSSSALTDILARLEALEAQMARITARGEEGTYELGQMQEQLAQLQAQVQQLESAGAPPPPSQPTGIIPPPGGAGGASSSSRPAAATSTGTPAPAASAPSPERVAAVRAIAKPATEDAGDDDYTYGFRLWEAGYFPEAQQQLALFLQRYPNHSRVTYGRNLLGRAYLDNGQPREAATYFFENYQANKQSARAPDSLLFLAEAMVAISDTNRACIALAEFGETYPALATGRLKEQYDRSRNRVRCS